MLPTSLTTCGQSLAVWTLTERSYVTVSKQWIIMPGMGVGIIYYVNSGRPSFVSSAEIPVFKLVQNRVKRDFVARTAVLFKLFSWNVVRGVDRSIEHFYSAHIHSIECSWRLADVLASHPEMRIVGVLGTLCLQIHDGFFFSFSASRLQEDDNTEKSRFIFWASHISVPYKQNVQYIPSLFF
jgi:hypothetical protein